MNGTKHAAVVRSPAIITHHEHVQRGHAHGAVVPPRVPFQIWLIQRAVINVYATVADAHLFAGQPHDALDQQLVLGTFWPLENHDVAPLRAVETIGDLLHDQPLVGMQVGLHAQAVNSRRLGQEGMDEQGNEHRRDNRLQQLAPDSHDPFAPGRLGFRIGLLYVVEHEVIARHHQLPCGRDQLWWASADFSVFDEAPRCHLTSSLCRRSRPTGDGTSAARRKGGGHGHVLPAPTILPARPGGRDESCG